MNQSKKNFEIENQKILSEKEKIFKKKKDLDEFLNKILLKQEEINLHKSKIQMEYNLVHEIEKIKENFGFEIIKNQKILDGKLNKIKIEEYNEKVLQKEEEVLVLKEIVHKNEKNLKTKKNEIFSLTKSLAKKQNIVKLKLELFEIMSLIEFEIQNKKEISSKGQNFKTLIEEKKYLIIKLVGDALYKEKQIVELEN